MGKVYDALKRAEEQRARRVHEAAATTSVPPLFEAEPTPAASAASAPTPPPRARGARLLANLARTRFAAARPETASAFNKRRITLLQPESFVAEQFRTLRARLDSLAASRPIRTLAVTSALPGDGKTLAAIGLAVVYSMQPGRRVVLVD